MIILTDGYHDWHTAKTAVCVIRYRPQEVVAVLDRQGAGQTCQELVMRLLAEELGLKPHELEPMTARGPVRPLRLDVFARS